MRLTVTIIILLTFFYCKGQNPTQELKIREVGWTLFIPTDTKFLNNAQFDTIQQKAVNAINKTYDISVEEEFKKIKSLFTIYQGQFNFFGSTLNPYDSSMFETWQQSYADSKIMLMDLFNQQGPDIKIADTASSSEIIDGLTFEKFYIKTIYPTNNLMLNTFWFYRKHRDYDFSINISYTDEKIGKMFLNILRNSKFEK
jgi:hypothetical protein